MNFLDKIKHKIWKAIYKFFVPTQRKLLRLGIIKHSSERQRYHLGWLDSSKTLEDLKKHLDEKWNFGNNLVAWVDKGQVLGWRKLVDFHHQYHLRVFEDGEIRGHFEYTPEARPIAHFREKGEEERREDFLKFLGNFVLQEKRVSHLKVDPDAFRYETHMTIEKIRKY
ncbi:MAG: hypothetical protein WCO07_02295 [bacterium]